MWPRLVIGSFVLALCAAGCATTKNASPAGPSASAAPATGKRTRDDLNAAVKLSFGLYPAPFDKVFAAVSEKLGKPDKVGDNMNEWYALDSGKCLSFFMTKAVPEGTAAVGIYDTSKPELCR